MTDTLQPRHRGLGGLSGAALKIIACVTMFIDHLGVYVYPDAELLRAVGRLSFPLFAYMIAEGCRYTRRKSKRFLLVFGTGLLCEIVYFLYAGEVDGGILMTFSVSILLIYEVQAIKKAWAQGRVGGLLCGLVGLTASLVGLVGFTVYVLRVSYGIAGALLPVLVSLCDYKEGETPSFFAKLDRKPIRLTVFAAGLLAVSADSFFPQLQLLGLLTLPLLALYNGRPGNRRLKYGFYLFYPLHFLVILLWAYLQA